MDLDSLIQKLISVAEQQGEQGKYERGLKRDFDLKKFMAEDAREQRKLDQADAERQRLSDMARLQSDTQRYGYDRSFEGSKYGSDAQRGIAEMQYGKGGSADRGYETSRSIAEMQGQTQRDISGMQHGPGGSWDRRNEAEKGMWSLRSAADQAAQEEMIRQKSMASIYETVFGQTGDANKAAEAARSFGASRPKQNIYDDDAETSQQTLTPEQRQRNTRQADDAYNRMFGGGKAQAQQQPTATPVQPKASLQQMAQPQPMQQQAPKTGFLPALRYSFNQFGVDTANPLRFMDEKLFGKRKQQTGIYR